MPDWSNVVTLAVAVLALAGTVFTLAAGRRKAQADTAKTDADAAKTIVDAARDLVELHIETAKAECLALVRKAVQESEERCEERAAKRRAERDREMAALKAELCKTRVESADVKQLLKARDDEMMQIVASLERQA